jgi:hypothetical protein
MKRDRINYLSIHTLRQSFYFEAFGLQAHFVRPYKVEAHLFVIVSDAVVSLTFSCLAYAAWLLP